jgi:hypothetical protein
MNSYQFYAQLNRVQRDKLFSLHWKDRSDIVQLASTKGYLWAMNILDKLKFDKGERS